ncbi:hypothetical protein JOB18_004301, partial [Solea senegalensis]
PEELGWRLPFGPAGIGGGGACGFSETRKPSAADCGSSEEAWPERRCASAGLGLRRLPLPSIILGNAQSLRNKVDELQANVKHISEYRDACVIALTETWLKDYDPTQDFDIDGFGQPYRIDRDAQITGKSLGGGVCLYVNPRWSVSCLLRSTSRPSRRGKLSAKRSLYGQRALFGN